MYTLNSITLSTKQKQNQRQKNRSQIGCLSSRILVYRTMRRYATHWVGVKAWTQMSFPFGSFEPIFVSFLQWLPLFLPLNKQHAFTAQLIDKPIKPKIDTHTEKEREIKRETEFGALRVKLWNLTIWVGLKRLMRVLERFLCCTCHCRNLHHSQINLKNLMQKPNSSNAEEHKGERDRG